MIIIPSVIISIIVIIELYLHFCYNKDGFKNQINTNVSDIWTRVEKDDDTNYKKYYVIVHDFDEKKFKQWNDIIPEDELEYIIETKEIMILSKDEKKAIAILNLIISHMQNNISMDDIIVGDLINRSIIKARKYDIVPIRLIELIKENNKKELNQLNIQDIETIDTSKFNNDIEPNDEDVKENKQVDDNSFENNHHKEFKLTSSKHANTQIKNKLNGYSGRQFATPKYKKYF